MSTRDEEFSGFVAARRPHLLRTAYALCGDWHRADDLVQTSLLKLYASWRRVEPGSEE
ncbi:MAG TPA: sigma factor, partial [Nocardioides sp.]